MSMIDISVTDVYGAPNAQRFSSARLKLLVKSTLYDPQLYVLPNRAHLFLPHPVDGEREGFLERSNKATQAKMISAVPYFLLQLDLPR